MRKDEKGGGEKKDRENMRKIKRRERRETHSGKVTNYLKAARPLYKGL